MSVEIMPGERVSEMSYEPSEVETALAAHVENIRDALDPKAFERFLTLPPERHNTLLTTAYAQQVETLSTYDQQALGAYVEFFVQGTDIDLCAQRYGVHPLDVEALVMNMPDYLRDMEPMILRSETTLGKTTAQNVIEVNFQPAAADTAPQEPVTVEPDTAPVAEVIAFEPEKPAFDPDFDFFAAAAEVHESDAWREQGKAMLLGMGDKGAQIWRHIGEDEVRSKAMNNALHDVHSQFERTRNDHRHMKVGSLSFDALANAFVGKKPDKQSTSYLTALAKRMNTVAGTQEDIEKARCVAFGIIATV